MGNTDNITQNRVNEIIAELTECRGDERDTQNQILQILIVCATLLGILLGASFFAGNPVVSLISAARILSASSSTSGMVVNANAITKGELN